VIPGGRCPAALLTALTGWWGWPGALFALLNGTAGWVLCVFGLVVLAGFLGDTDLVTELINSNWISSFAISSGFAVNNSLWTQSQLWPAVVSFNIDSISNC